MKTKKIQFYLGNPSRHLYSFVEETTKPRLILIIYALVTALYRGQTSTLFCSRFPFRVPQIHSFNLRFLPALFIVISFNMFQKGNEF